MTRAPSQDEIADGFVVIHQHTYRFEPFSKTWHRWSGRAWDVSELVRHMLDRRELETDIVRKLKAVCRPMNDHVFQGVRQHCRFVADRYALPTERSKFGSLPFVNGVMRFVERDPNARVTIYQIGYCRAPLMSDLVREAIFAPNNNNDDEDLNYAN